MFTGWKEGPDEEVDGNDGDQDKGETTMTE